MLVTVFTSCYNQGRYLAEAIESVLEQDFEDFEYLLFNDGSTDETSDIMHDYASRDKRIKVFDTTKQRNVSVLVNKSIFEAEGSYWVWCPSDDVLAYNLLSRKVEESKKYPNAIIYDNWFVIDEAGRKLLAVDVKPMTPSEFSEEVWHSSPIGFTGIWIPAYILSVLPFPEHLVYSEDFFWMIKATIHGFDFRGIQERLHYKRKHTNTTTSKNINAILDQIPIIRKDLRKYKEWYDGNS
jgi:glycosyltransferase involved in cell wall biosynthesis